METIKCWLRVRDLERELAAAGFTYSRSRGSHRSYTSAESGARITFSPCRERHGARHGLVHPLVVVRVRREMRAACLRAVESARSSFNQNALDS